MCTTVVPAPAPAGECGAAIVEFIAVPRACRRGENANGGVIGKMVS
jgi:hypothetical protein